MKSKIVNLTDHVVNLYDSLGINMVLAIPPSGEVARVQSTLRVLEWPVARYENNRVIGLPEPVEGTVYVVSEIVRQALPYRKDIGSPKLPVKVGNGYVGCRAIILNPI